LGLDSADKCFHFRGHPPLRSNARGHSFSGALITATVRGMRCTQQRTAHRSTHPSAQPRTPISLLQQAASASKFEAQGQGTPGVGAGRRDLLAQRAQRREGRRPHSNASELPSAVGRRAFTDWDGQPSWEWDNPRTLYFEPVAGLGNRLRALCESLWISERSGGGGGCRPAMAL